MSEDMIEAGDTDALAAEYVLGTLDAGERIAAQGLLARDAGFATKVKVWERRLGELHLMVEPVEPEPDIWQRIKAKLPEVQQPDLALTLAKIEAEVALTPRPEPEPKPTPTLKPPELKRAPEPRLEAEAKARPGTAAESVPSGRDAPPAMPDVIALPPWSPTQVQPQPAAPVTATDKPAPGARVGQAEGAAGAQVPPFAVVPTARPAPTGDQDERLRIIRRHLVGWRTVAVLMTLAVVAVAGLLALWKYEPERVPPHLRPLALMRLVGITIDTSSRPRRPAPPESQFDE
jgi:hypothetical protein